MKKDKRKNLDKKLGSALHYLEDINHVVRGIRSVVKIVNRISGMDDGDDEDEDEE